jgi:peptide/nickel transport system substrate-binding protein
MNNPANSVPTRQGFDQIKSIDEPDRSTVVVHLKAPYGAIVSKLFSSAGIIAILPKHVLGALHDMNTAPFNGLPIGMGPFRYAAWNRGDSVVLERNPYYWHGQPALERFVFKIIPDRNTVVTQLQTGELELFYPFGGAFLSRVAAIPHIHVIRQPGYGINQLMLNTNNPALADVAVRTALRYAIDRQLIRDKVGHGVGILQNVVVSTVDPSTPKDIRFTPFSLERANAILNAAGWKRGPDGVRAKNGTRLSLQVASSVGTPDADTIIELVRSWWTDRRGTQRAPVRVVHALWAVRCGRDSRERQVRRDVLGPNHYRAVRSHASLRLCRHAAGRTEL